MIAKERVSLRKGFVILDMTTGADTSRTATQQNIKFISGLLKSQNAFHCVGIPQIRLYSAATYLNSRNPAIRRVHALMDRATVSTLAELIRGRSIRRGNRTEMPWLTAAAAMAFFRVSGVDVTFNLNTYQVAAKRKHPDATTDIEDFRIAGMLEAQEWLDLSVGNKDRLNNASVAAARSRTTAPDVQKSSFTQTLSLWNMYYVYALKLLELYREPGLTGMERIDRFYKWQLQEAIFSSICSLWALFLLSDAPVSKSFKNLSAMTPDKTKAALENNVWDMVTLQQLKANISERKNTWILCTVDKDIQDIAACAFPVIDREGTLKRSLSQLYDARHVNPILSLYLELEQTAKLPVGRDSHAENFFRNLGRTQSGLEQKLGFSR